MKRMDYFLKAKARTEKKINAIMQELEEKFPDYAFEIKKEIFTAIDNKDYYRYSIQTKPVELPF